jgi:diadenosine tetraphosphatase ApaH/serine/threonine PP2A family protein phosphatase
VHGSPSSNEEYLLEDKEEGSFLNVFRNANADIICCGHSHKPYYRVLSETTDTEIHFRHAINIGSVGKPKDGDPRGCYVLLTINNFSNTKVAECIGVEFIRVQYDIEKAARAVEDSPLPNEFADMLRKAY